MRAASTITSITMKGGTLLRPEAVSRIFARSLSVDSSIAICYLHPLVDLQARFRVPAPVTAPDWPYSVAPYSVFKRCETGSREEKRVKTRDCCPVLF